MYRTFLDLQMTVTTQHLTVICVGVYCKYNTVYCKCSRVYCKYNSVYCK